MHGREKFMWERGGPQDLRLKLTRRSLLRTCVVLAGGAGAAGLLGACGGSQVNPAATPAQSVAPSTVSTVGSLQKVRYGNTGAGYHPFIARDQGYFAELGIEHELSRFDSAADMIAPLGA